MKLEAAVLAAAIHTVLQAEGARNGRLTHAGRSPWLSSGREELLR